MTINEISPQQALDRQHRGAILIDVREAHERAMLGATLFGKRSALPLAIAPTGAAGLCWYEGELALARAAAKAGVPFTMAIGSTTALEKVAACLPGRVRA